MVEIAQRLGTVPDVRIPRLQRQFLPHHAADLFEEPPSSQLRRSRAGSRRLPFAFGVVACLVGGSLSDAIIRRWGKRWGRRLVGVAGLAAAGLAILAVPWVENVVALGFLLVLAFFGNDLAMAPAWAAAADIGERYTGILSGAMNMVASFMAAVEAIVARTTVPIQTTSSCRSSSSRSATRLGTLAWIGVDVRTDARRNA